MSDQDLKLALTAQSKRYNSPNLAKNVLDEIKASEAFQQPWQDMLQSATVTVAAIGSLYVAASSGAATRTQLQQPNQGFRYLERDQLLSTLIRCADYGREAFREAQSRFTMIHRNTANVSQMLRDMIETLGDGNDETAKQLLDGQIMQLKSLADKSLDGMRAIDQRFETWLFYTTELYAACIATQATDDAKLKATAISLIAEQTKFDPQSDKIAGPLKEKFKKQFNLASEAFEMASKDFPSECNILSEQIVAGLADMMTTTLGQVVWDSTTQLNPMGKVSKDVGMFDSILQPPGGTTTAPPLQNSPVVAYKSDSAYGNIQTILPNLALLGSILRNAGNNEVDWDAAKSASKPVNYIFQSLCNAKSAIEPSTSNDNPGQELMTILKTSIRIAEELKDATAAGSSPRVAQWQADFDDIMTKAMKMASIARSLPGTAPGGIPLMANAEDLDQKIGKVDAKSIQARAAVESIRNRFWTAQYKSVQTQELYQKVSSLLQNQENTLSKTTANLQRACQSDMGMTEVVMVIETTLKLVINMKANIVDLCVFYNSMSITIDALVNSAVSPFLNDSNSSNFKVGDYTLKDLRRSILYQAVVTIGAQFRSFRDIASYWARLQDQYIMPGVQMINGLSMSAGMGDPGQMQGMAGQLFDWAGRSFGDLKDVTKKGEEDVFGIMSERMDAIKDVVNQLPASRGMQVAITTGADTAKQAALDAIVSKFNAKPLNRFAA